MNDCARAVCARRGVNADGAAAGQGEINGFPSRTSLFPDARGHSICC